MSSAVDIANEALDQIGARFSISSLAPPMPPPNANVVARLYQSKIDALHRAAHWNFARVQQPLTLLKAAQGTPENPAGTTIPIPPIPWQYEYAYPSDCLLARYLIPNPPGGSSITPPVFGGGVFATPGWSPFIGYKFAVGVSTDQSIPPQQIRAIWTDLEYAQAVYTARILNPDLWDPAFHAAAVSTLAAWLVNPLARDAGLVKEQMAIATSLIQQARISDGNEGVTSTDHVPDWLAVRGFSGYEFINGPQTYVGWSGMGFPGGILF